MDNESMMDKNNKNVTCILYGEAQDARAAWGELRRSDLASPVKVSLHQGDIAQDQYTFAQTRSRGGAIIGALTVGLPSAIFLGFASSAEVLASLHTTTALLVGLFGGGLLGALTGMLVGSTEPPAVLARAQDAVRHGKVALVAYFAEPRQARLARRFLESRPGAITSLT